MYKYSVWQLSILLEFLVRPVQFARGAMKLSVAALIALLFFTVADCGPCKSQQPACPYVEGIEHDLTILPFITDCTKYILCQRGTPIVRPCPGDLIFNAELKVCDYPNRTKCIQCNEDDDAVTESHPTTFETSTETNTPILSTSTTAATPTHEWITQTIAV